MTKAKPLHSINVASLDQLVQVEWTMKTTSEEFRFSSPAESFGKLIVETFLRLAVRPQVARHAKPVPRIWAREIGEAKPLPIMGLGAFVVPMSEKVGFDIEMPGGIHLVFQISKLEAMQFSEHLQEAIRAPHTPISTHRH